MKPAPKPEVILRPKTKIQMAMGQDLCEAESPEVEGFTFICTREKNHPGDHVGHGRYGREYRPVARWPQAKPPKEGGS